MHTLTSENPERLLDKNTLSINQRLKSLNYQIKKHFWHVRLALWPWIANCRKSYSVNWGRRGMRGMPDLLYLSRNICFSSFSSLKSSLSLIVGWSVVTASVSSSSTAVRHEGQSSAVQGSNVTDQQWLTGEEVERLVDNGCGYLRLDFVWELGCDVDFRRHLIGQLWQRTDALIFYSQRARQQDLIVEMVT